MNYYDYRRLMKRLIRRFGALRGRTLEGGDVVRAKTPQAAT